MLTPTPQWAIDRAYALANERGHIIDLPCGAVSAFAAYIAAHEEPPVDPLVAVAREICGKVWYDRGNPRTAAQFDNGDFDACKGPSMSIAMAALQRGIELGKST